MVSYLITYQDGKQVPWLSVYAKNLLEDLTKYHSFDTFEMFLETVIAPTDGIKVIHPTATDIVPISKEEYLKLISTKQ